MKNVLTVDQIMDLTQGIPLTRNVLRNALETASKDQRTFMADLLTAEHASRQRARQDRLLRQARFPLRKTLNDYDYSMITWPANWQQSDLLSLEFIANHHDLVLYGDVGTGKTHLAIGLGHAACQAGYATRFFTAASLIAYLRQAQYPANQPGPETIPILINISNHYRAGRSHSATKKPQLSVESRWPDVAQHSPVSAA